MNTICRRTGVTGRCTPAISPTAADHAPAAQITVGAAMSPWSVCTTPGRSPVTAHRVSMCAPRPRAANAYPATTASGVRWPSVGQKAAPSMPAGSIGGHTSCASAGVSIRLGTPRPFCSATPASNSRMSSSRVSRNR